LEFIDSVSHFCHSRRLTPSGLVACGLICVLVFVLDMNKRRDKEGKHNNKKKHTKQNKKQKSEFSSVHT
jgi:hypothetical protein